MTAELQKEKGIREIEENIGRIVPVNAGRASASPLREREIGVASLLGGRTKGTEEDRGDPTTKKVYTISRLYRETAYQTGGKLDGVINAGGSEGRFLRQGRGRSW